MNINKIFTAAVLVILTLPMTSCLGDLDKSPAFGLNSSEVYNDPSNYINVLAKLYAGLATTGNAGPAGQADIAGIDEGFSSYLRILWNLQTVTTDEAVLGWNDPGVPELNYMDISSVNPWVVGMYYRIYFQLTLCNDFIRESELSRLEDRGFGQADIDRILEYRNEARFLRALSYYHALDLFGNVPFVTEDDAPGAFFPEQISRVDLYDYVESELLELESALPDPKANEYGRADKAAVWMTLAKLYLNSEVYNGSNNYTQCAEYCSKVINAGYSLEAEYAHLFLADNHMSNEVVFPVTFDGTYTQTWGGTTYLVHAPVGGTMDPTEFGINGGWAGLRASPELVTMFADTTETRWMFWTDGQQLDIEELGTFAHGYGVTKWKNVTSDGIAGSDGTGNHVDTDFPMYRLADAYLMYAEAALRGGGDVGTGLTYVNQLRERAYGDASGNFGSIDLQTVLDERARELYWEGGRRTDLIRYGLFTGGAYLWTFKGQEVNGTSLPEHKKLFPLPAADLVANTNLEQNPGY